MSGQYGGVAARVLDGQGVTPGKIRNEIMKNITAGYPREGETEPSGKAIEAWVGRQVRVAVENMGNGEPGRFACTLGGVDDRGIVVGYESGTQRITRFYAWRTVPYINLAKSEGAKQAPRRAGFTQT